MTQGTAWGSLCASIPAALCQRENRRDVECTGKRKEGEQARRGGARREIRRQEQEHTPRWQRVWCGGAGPGACPSGG